MKRRRGIDRPNRKSMIGLNCCYRDQTDVTTILESLRVRSIFYKKQWGLTLSNSPDLQHPSFPVKGPYSMINTSIFDLSRTDPGQKRTPVTVPGLHGQSRL